MTSASQMNRVIAQSGGDVSKINELLGTEFKVGDKLIRIDVNDPLSYNPRPPSNSMSGANTQFVPGGSTSGGISEVVTDPLPADSVWATPVE